MSDREAILRWNDSISGQIKDNSSEPCELQDIQYLAKKKKPPIFDLRNLTEKNNSWQKKQCKKSSCLAKKKNRLEKKFTEGSFNPYCMHALAPDYSFELQETARFVGELHCDEGITKEFLEIGECKKHNHPIQSFVTSEMQECSISEEIKLFNGIDKYEEVEPFSSSGMVEPFSSCESVELCSSFEKSEMNNKEPQEKISGPSSFEEETPHDLKCEDRERIEEETGDDYMDHLDEKEQEKMPKIDESMHVPLFLGETNERSEFVENVEISPKIDFSVKDISFHSLDGLANVVLQAHKEMQGEQTTEVTIPIAGTDERIQVTLTTYQTAPTEYNLALTGMPPSAVLLALRNKAVLIDQLASRGIRVHQLLLSECGRHNTLSVRKTRSEKSRISNAIFKNGTSKQ